MPRIVTSTDGNFYEPDASGPVAQADLSRTKGPGASIAAGATYDTGILPADGFKILTAAVKMSQAGTLTLTRYLDAAGLLPQGAPASAAVSANTVVVLNVADNLPFTAFRLTLANSGGAVAAVAAYALLLNAN